MRGSSEAQRLPFCARGLRVIEARLREEGRSDQTDRLTVISLGVGKVRF
jgi:hypothetical protein